MDDAGGQRGPTEDAGRSGPDDAGGGRGATDASGGPGSDDAGGQPGPADDAGRPGSGPEGALAGIAAMFGAVAACIRPGNPASVLRAVSEVAVARVRGATAAGVTGWDGARFTVLHGTDDRAREADRLQHGAHAGPTVEVALGALLAQVGDTRPERRWVAVPEPGPALADLGYHSVLALRLCDEDRTDGPVVVLTLYAETARAFDPVAVRTAQLLAAYGGQALAQARAALRVLDLERALVSTKAIGPAIGLVMAQYKIGHDEAMDLLRKISQRINRKVSDLAAEVVRARALSQPGPPATPTGR